MPGVVAEEEEEDSPVFGLSLLLREEEEAELFDLLDSVSLSSVTEALVELSFRGPASLSFPSVLGLSNDPNSPDDVSPAAFLSPTETAADDEDEEDEEEEEEDEEEEMAADVLSLSFCSASARIEAKELSIESLERANVSLLSLRVAWKSPELYRNSLNLSFSLPSV